MNWVVEGLVKRGMPRHIAEGFAMNFQDESGLNPGINERNPTVPGSRGGFGLAQWTGPRRVALETFAAHRKRPAADPEIQMDFLMTELAGPEAAAWSRISAAKTPGEAGAAVVNAFLRPAETHRARRESEYLRGGGTGSPAPAAKGILAGMEPPKTEREKRMGILAELGASLAPQQVPVAQIQPVQRMPYAPAKRDNTASLLRFFQSIG